jgi:hypothetical protein
MIVPTMAPTKSAYCEFGSIFTNHTKSAWLVEDMDRKIGQGCRKDICGAIDQMVWRNVCIREVFDDIKFFKLPTDILDGLFDNLSPTDFSIRNLQNQLCDEWVDCHKEHKTANYQSIRIQNRYLHRN